MPTAATLKPSKSRKNQSNSQTTPTRPPLNEARPPAIAEHSTFSESAPVKPLPTEEEISQRAYALAEERQRTGETGDALGDWLRAEQELIAKAR